MILDTLAAAQRVSWRFIRDWRPASLFWPRADLAGLPDGRHEIDGTRVFALVGRDAGRGQAGAVGWRRTGKYLDIQVAIEGRRTVRLAAAGRLPAGGRAV